MRSRILSEAESGASTLLLIYDSGDEVVTQLLTFALENKISAAQFSAIGAFERGIVAFYDLNRKEYLPIPINQQVEVLALIGNITMYRGDPRIHAHVTLGLSDGTAAGGHLIEGIVKPTLEMFLSEWPVRVERKLNEKAGLPLIDPSIV